MKIIDTCLGNHISNEFENNAYEPQNIEYRISNVEVAGFASAVRYSLFDIRYSKSFLFAFLLFLMACLAQSPMEAAAKKLNVVATTEDMASLAQEVGGDRINVDAIAKGYQDPHFVEAKPSFLLKLRQADLLIGVGLELEIGWLPPLINQSGNRKIQDEKTGYLDASRFCEILEKSQGAVTRAEGDVHPQGNPHYWLDPDNGRRAALGIEKRLAELDPGNAAYFQQRFEDFDKRLSAAEQKWDAAMKPYRGQKVITYHRSFTNFAKHFGLDVIGYVEPRPGIPPSPAHTMELIQLIKREKCKAVLVEPYFDLKTPQAIGRESGAQVVVYLPSVGGEKQVRTYLDLFDYDIALIVKAFQTNR
jgi:zinc/manganese transport system substrate-binding protein